LVRIFEKQKIFARIPGLPLDSGQAVRPQISIRVADAHVWPSSLGVEITCQKSVKKLTMSGDG
jgi:hypothetical protein